MVSISGYITKSLLSGSMQGSKTAKDNYYCFLNGRPVDIPRKFKQILTDIYRQFNESSNPIVILRLLVEDDNYDINVSPDKREVFIKNERDILPLFRAELE